METRSSENRWGLDHGREHRNAMSLEPQDRRQQAAMTGRGGAFRAQAEQQEHRRWSPEMTMTVVEAIALA